jgi:hypothetical protein
MAPADLTMNVNRQRDTILDAVDQMAMDAWRHFPLRVKLVRHLPGGRRIVQLPSSNSSNPPLLRLLRFTVCLQPVLAVWVVVCAC